MVKKIICMLIVMGIGWLSLPGDSHAIRLLTKDEALRKVFGNGMEIVTENKQLTDTVKSRIKERLEKELAACSKGPKQKEVELKDEMDFYFYMKDGKKDKVAVIEEQQGKWGLVQFVIAMDLKGTVTEVEVMDYQEKRGQPIARNSFVSQFVGKTSKDPIQVDKDITGISGATISSTCATFAVKKAIILYEETYLSQ